MPPPSKPPGFQPPVVRELAIGRVFSRVAEKLRSRQGEKPGRRSLVARTRGFEPTPASREQQLVARRELSDALVAAFGMISDSEPVISHNSRFSVPKSARRCAESFRTTMR